MRSQTISISERDLIFVTAGQLFDQAPNRQPRKAEIIMQKVRDAFRKDANNSNEYYSLRIAENELYDYIKNILMAIPEFTEVNLSQIEFENNISVDDESRGKYKFTSRYDKEDSESWKNDFIDLDAFIRNVYNKLFMVMESDIDCFCCASEKTKDCLTCTANPEYKYKFKGSRKPKGEYTFSCKYDCPRQYQICCEECKKKDSCTTKCDGESATCGNTVK